MRLDVWIAQHDASPPTCVHAHPPNAAPQGVTPSPPSARRRPRRCMASAMPPETPRRARKAAIDIDPHPAASPSGVQRRTSPPALSSVLSSAPVAGAAAAPAAAGAGRAASWPLATRDARSPSVQNTRFNHGRPTTSRLPPRSTAATLRELDRATQAPPQAPSTTGVPARRKPAAVSVGTRVESPPSPRRRGGSSTTASTRRAQRRDFMGDGATVRAPNASRRCRPTPTSRQLGRLAGATATAGAKRSRAEVPFAEASPTNRAPPPAPPSRPGSARATAAHRAPHSSTLVRRQACAQYRPPAARASRPSYTVAALSPSRQVLSGRACAHRRGWPSTKRELSQHGEAGAVLGARRNEDRRHVLALARRRASSPLPRRSWRRSRCSRVHGAVDGRRAAPRHGVMRTTRRDVRRPNSATCVAAPHPGRTERRPAAADVGVWRAVLVAGASSGSRRDGRPSAAASEHLREGRSAGPSSGVLPRCVTCCALLRRRSATSVVSTDRARKLAARFCEPPRRRAHVEGQGGPARRRHPTDGERKALGSRSPARRPRAARRAGGSASLQADCGRRGEFEGRGGR